jgi:cytochrome c oxidase subunit 2
VVPLGRTVLIRLRSKDVIHSFFLPHLRVKQDAVPGMTPEVVFVPTRAGAFDIACTELCGLGHYRMQGVFRVVPDSEYRLWLQQQAPGGA